MTGVSYVKTWTYSLIDRQDDFTIRGTPVSDRERTRDDRGRKGPSVSHSRTTYYLPKSVRLSISVLSSRDLGWTTILFKRIWVVDNGYLFSSEIWEKTMEILRHRCHTPSSITGDTLSRLIGNKRTTDPRSYDFDPDGHRWGLFVPRDVLYQWTVGRWVESLYGHCKTQRFNYILDWKIQLYQTRSLCLSKLGVILIRFRLPFPLRENKSRSRVKGVVKVGVE